MTYWETGRLKANAMLEEASCQLDEKIDAGELNTQTKSEAGAYFRQYLGMAKKRSDVIFDKTFYDRVYNGIYKKYGL